LADPAGVERREGGQALRLPVQLGYAVDEGGCVEVRRHGGRLLDGQRAGLRGYQPCRTQLRDVERDRRVRAGTELVHQNVVCQLGGCQRHHLVVGREQRGEQLLVRVDGQGQVDAQVLLPVRHVEDVGQRLLADRAAAVSAGDLAGERAAVGRRRQQGPQGERDA